MNSDELQLELQLADLLFPDYTKTFSENGSYWYMNDSRIVGANFKGYVPKWTRDDAACFQLMSEHRCWPNQQIGGMAYPNSRILCASYDEHEQYEHENDVDFKRRIDRLAVVKSVLDKLRQEKKEKKT